METLGQLGIIICGLTIGFCIYKEIELYTEWIEERRQKTKSHLRLGPGGFVLGKGRTA